MNYYSPNVFLDLSKSQTCCYRHLQNVFYAVMTNQRSLLWRSSTKESKAKRWEKTNKQTNRTNQTKKLRNLRNLGNAVKSGLQNRWPLWKCVCYATDLEQSKKYYFRIKYFLTETSETF